jgi:hypothetical protein
MRFGLAAVLGFGLMSVFQQLHAADVVKNVTEPTISSLLAAVDSFKDIQTESGLLVKIYRTSYPGECDPGDEAKTCPRSELLFVSGLNTEGLYSPKTWKTAKLIDWQVNKTTEAVEKTKDGQPLDTVLVDATVCRAPDAVENGKVPATGGQTASASTWWSKVKFEFIISADRITIRQIGSTGELCDLY